MHKKCICFSLFFHFIATTVRLTKQLKYERKFEFKINTIGWNDDLKILRIFGSGAQHNKRICSLYFDLHLVVFVDFNDKIKLTIFVSLIMYAYRRIHYENLHRNIFDRYANKFVIVLASSVQSCMCGVCTSIFAEADAKLRKLQFRILTFQ